MVLASCAPARCRASAPAGQRLSPRVHLDSTWAAVVPAMPPVAAAFQAGWCAGTVAAHAPTGCDRIMRSSLERTATMYCAIQTILHDLQTIGTVHRNGRRSRNRWHTGHTTHRPGMVPSAGCAITCRRKLCK
jgi:hypothetical protein